MVNTIQVDTMYQLLLYKGYFTEAEFLAKMKEVQISYMTDDNHSPTSFKNTANYMLRIDGPKFFHILADILCFDSNILPKYIFNKLKYVSKKDLF